MGWRSKVYFHEPEPEGLTREEWIFLRRTVIRRDGFKCLRCDKRFPVHELTAHHMTPRDEGGSNDISNLVTLCQPCHDFVEINNLRTRADIMGSMEQEQKENIELSKPSSKDWRTWVYGGARNPNL